MDSSGFGTSRFEKRFDAKYGMERKRATWVKTHVCVGVRTNVVTADKAYLPRENLELVESPGAAPYIPFKVNNRADKYGPTW